MGKCSIMTASAAVGFSRNNLLYIESVPANVYSRVS